MWPHAHTYPPHAHIPHAHTLHMPTVVDVISKYQFWPLTLWHHFVPGFRLHTHTSSLARWKTHIISKTFEIACSYCCWNALSSLVEIALPLLNVVVSAITTSHHDDHSKKHFWCCCLLLCCSAVWDIYMSRCVCVCVCTLRLLWKISETYLAHRTHISFNCFYSMHLLLLFVIFAALLQRCECISGWWVWVCVGAYTAVVSLAIADSSDLIHVSARLCWYRCVPVTLLLYCCCCYFVFIIIIHSILFCSYILFSLVMLYGDEELC